GRLRTPPGRRRAALRYTSAPTPNQEGPHAMLSSLEIAQEATLRPIADVAEEAGIEPDELELYGRYKAKVDLSILERLADQPDGKIVNVTAITPTPAGEGKTTTSVALTQGLGQIGRRPVLALREHGPAADLAEPLRQ